MKFILLLKFDLNILFREISANKHRQTMYPRYSLYNLKKQFDENYYLTIYSAFIGP